MGDGTQRLRAGLSSVSPPGLGPRLWRARGCRVCIGIESGSSLWGFDTDADADPDTDARGEGLPGGLFVRGGRVGSGGFGDPREAWRWKWDGRGRSRSLSPSHGSVGRVPSSGACIEDFSRAADRQFIAAKHPFRRGSVLRAKPTPNRPNANGVMSPSPGLAEARGLPWVTPPRRIPTATRLWPFLDAGPRVISQARQPMAKGQSPFPLRLCFACANSCPWCASWSKTLTSLNHESHQAHESLNGPRPNREQGLPQETQRDAEKTRPFTVPSPSAPPRLCARQVPVPSIARQEAISRRGAGAQRRQTAFVPTRLPSRLRVS